MMRIWINEFEMIRGIKAARRETEREAETESKSKVSKQRWANSSSHGRFIECHVRAYERERVNLNEARIERAEHKTEFAIQLFMSENQFHLKLTESALQFRKLLQKAQNATLLLDINKF